MMKPVKVCCFCEKWESGGIESFLHNVLLHMDLHDIHVDIVAAELAESIFAQPLRKRGIRFIELSGKQQKLSQNYRLFRNLLQEENYDVIHLNIFHGLSLYYAHLAKRAGIPVRIAHSHNTALRKSRTRVLKQMIHCASKELFTGSATDLWACSEAAAKFLFSPNVLKKREFKFIPNGINIERFRFDAAVREKVRRELRLDGKFVIGNIGRLCYQKNQDFLLDVFSEVIRCRPKSCLLLIGEGAAEADLRQKAKRLGISDAVIFYGTSAHIEQLLWAMDVFVFPSRFEGLGIAAVEAQAAGLPVLCSEYVPNEACVTSQFQSLTLKDGAARWAEKLLELGGMQYDRAKSVNAVQRAGFDIQSVARIIEQQFIGGMDRT